MSNRQLFIKKDLTPMIGIRPILIFNLTGFFHLLCCVFLFQHDEFSGILKDSLAAAEHLHSVEIDAGGHHLSEVIMPIPDKNVVSGTVRSPIRKSCNLLTQEIVKDD